MSDLKCMAVFVAQSDWQVKFKLKISSLQYNKSSLTLLCLVSQVC